MKLKKDGTPRKQGSGRTKGALSLVSVKMSDLAEKFGPNDLVVCGRIFVEKAGIGIVGKAVSAPLTETEKAGITLIE
jgi:hypothetical protein